MGKEEGGGKGREGREGRGYERSDGIAGAVERAGFGRRANIYVRLFIFLRNASILLVFRLETLVEPFALRQLLFYLARNVKAHEYSTGASSNCFRASPCTRS